MIYGSVCSGIEAASVAWHPLGWKAAWLSEIEKFPSAVLAHHYPNTPNLGDMTRLHDHPERSPIELLVGGTPCQSFSIAGLRTGMADPRGNLALVFLGLAAVARPRWIVWENVPGVLSSNGGRDFASFLTALGQLGYGWSYRVLDAQNFGVPQRRRRVFVVGYLGDWRRAAAVLFEQHSLRGNPAKGRKTGEEVARSARQGSENGSHWDGTGVHPCLNQSASGSGIGASNQEIFSQRGAYLEPGKPEDGQERVGDNTLLTRENDPHRADTGNYVVDVPIKQILDMRGNGNGRTFPTIAGDHAGRPTDHTPTVYSLMPQNSGKDFKAREVAVTQPLMAAGPGGGNQGGDIVLEPTVIFDPFNNKASEVSTSLGTNCGMSTGRSIAFSQELTPKVASSELDNLLDAVGGKRMSVMVRSSVRRLTPVECERLQGFPDDYTRIAWRKKLAADCPDGPRYKAIGNSMAVPVMAWIGKRIEMVEAIK